METFAGMASAYLGVALAVAAVCAAAANIAAIIIPMLRIIP